LRALGAPREAAGAGLDWEAIVALDAAGWRAHGVGAARARELVAFFGHPEVRALAAPMRAAGVAGFH